MSAADKQGITEVQQSLQKIADEEVIDLRLVSLVAGDAPVDAETRQRLDALRADRGERFYADLVFALTNHHFPYEKAEDLWNQILSHRDELREALERNPGVAVAALDYMTNYLSNRSSQMRLIPQDDLAVMADLALRDDLTHLYTRVTFESRLHDEINRFKRYGNPVCLLMMDLDDFKTLNDRYGHPRGDVVLTQVSRIIREQVREVDIPCRYGGEEFAVLMPQSTRREGQALAERMRTRIATDSHPDTPVTASFGVAACPAHARDPRRLVGAADRALYTAKRAGKDRVRSAGELADGKGVDG